MENQNQVPPQTQLLTPQVSTSPVQPLSPEPKHKGKIWKIIGIIVGSVIVIFILLVWYGSKLDNQQTENNKPITNNINTTTMTIIFKEFFPNISGNISDYKINLPEGYVKYVVPEDLAPGTFLWGNPEDIKIVTADQNTIAFDQSKAGIFRVRFTQNAGVDSNGQISDGNGPMTEAGFANQGMTDINIIKGSFFGIAGAPVVVITGKVQNKTVYMAYSYSPVDNLVVLTSLQGGTDDNVNKSIWDAFVASLNIKSQ
jgi:hypothetical protein